MEELYKPKTCKICGETLVSSICHMCDGEGTIDDTATDPLEGDEFSLCPECRGAGLYLDCPNAPHEATALDKVISICDVDGLLLKADTELRRKVCQEARVELSYFRAEVQQWKQNCRVLNKTGDELRATVTALTERNLYLDQAVFEARQAIFQVTVRSWTPINPEGNKIMRIPFDVYDRCRAWYRLYPGSDRLET